MLYTLVLYLHSWLRWVVVIAGIALVARCAFASVRSTETGGRAWAPLDDRLGRIFVASLDTQFLLGISLYLFLSPLTPKSLADLRAFMKVTPLRFFAVEHLTGMLVALVVAHIVWARAKRKSGAARQKSVAIGIGIALLIIFASIPWPGTPYARALLRLPSG